MTRSEIEAIFRKEKSSHLPKIGSLYTQSKRLPSPTPKKTRCLNLKNLSVNNTKKHVVCFLDFMGPTPQYQSLLDRVIRVSDRHDVHLLSQLETGHSKVLGAPHVPIQWQVLLHEAKFILSKDQNIYLRRFHEKAMDCCDSVEEEVLVNVYLYGMEKNI